MIHVMQKEKKNNIFLPWCKSNSQPVSERVREREIFCCTWSKINMHCVVIDCHGFAYKCWLAKVLWFFFYYCSVYRRQSRKLRSKKKINRSFWQPNIHLICSIIAHFFVDQNRFWPDSCNEILSTQEKKNPGKTK